MRYVCVGDSLTALEGERQQFGGGEGGTGLAQVWKWEVTGVLVAPAWALRWLELDPLSGCLETFFSLATRWGTNVTHF